MARIAIDEELWRRTRVMAFERGVSGADIVNEALRHYLATGEETTVVATNEDQAEALFEQAAAIARTDNRVGAPRPSEHPPVPLTPLDEPSTQEDPWKSLSGSDPDQPPPSRRPSSTGKTITDVEAARQVAASLPPVRPVPKPSARRKR